MKMAFLLIFFALIFSSCGRKEVTVEEQVLINKIQTPENLNVFYNSMNQLTVQVIYETGAEPYTGKTLRDKYYWQLLEDNIQAVFTARTQTVAITVPKTLAEMTEIPSATKETWTAEEIVAKAEAVGNPNSAGNQGRFVILFLNGHFKNGEDIALNVIGLNVTGTTVIAIFKDVVRDMENLRGEQIAKFGEQSTLVHEMGHALGLVNNGVPMTTSHQDTEHGAHCSNANCVMYWQNEGGQAFLDFLQRIMQSGDTVLYGQECIDDFKNYKP